MASTESAPLVHSEWMQFAPLIILLPMIAFAVILFLGRVFNGHPFWKKNLKEGGLIALPVMGASLILSLLLISEFLKGNSGVDQIFEQIAWINTGIWNGGSTLSLIHI